MDEFGYQCGLYVLVVLVLAGILDRIRRRTMQCRPRVSLRRLHRDQVGAVQSLSFVLTLPIFVVLMLFIIQLSQLTVARIFVEYAAYAAARSASVWVPAHLDNEYETANRVGPAREPLGTIEDENGNHWDRYRLSHPSRKLTKIELAAAQALMSICPSRDVGVEPQHVGVESFDSILRAYLAMHPEADSNDRIPNRLRNKLAYALAATQVEIEVRHKDTEPPLTWHDIRPHRAEFEPNEIGWQDQLLVTVRHEFALLPGPARLLAKSTGPEDRVAERIQQRPGVFVYPLTATVRLGNEGEKSVLAYVESRRMNFPPGTSSR